MSQFNFPINAALSAIAIAYANPDITLIADKVLPRITVAQLFKWTKYNLADAFTVPNTRVGPKSEPNKVDFKGVELQDQVIDWGLDDLISVAELAAFEAMPKPEGEGGPLSPEEHSTMFIMNLVKLDREIRVANLVFNTATYPAGNQSTLSGTSQWSDVANSDPVAAIGDALDVPIVRPNKMVLGRLAWTKLRRHPKIVQACNATNQSAGIAARQQVADLFELQEILVGDSFVNNARRGQAATMARTWGKNCALIYSSEEAAKLRMPTFGFTGQFGNQIAGEIAEPKKGLRGSKLVRAGESVKEIICANDVGYYIANCVA